MKVLERIKNPKGELLSTFNQAIVKHLQANGPCDAVTLDNALTKLDGYYDDAGLSRLQRRLTHLRTDGHVHRVLIGQRLCWRAGPEPEHQPERPIVTPPRRVNVMSGPDYSPGWTVARPGAMDYADKPSLHMGKRRAFRSEVV